MGTTAVMTAANLRELRDGITSNRTTRGTLRSIVIAFNAQHQTLRFECGRIKLAKQIALEIGGARRGTNVVVIVPQSMVEERLIEARQRRP
jgi:hypothetical protein